MISVFPNRQRKLHTTHSWDFLGLGSKGVPTPASLWRKSNYGDGVIIGNLDTGKLSIFLTVVQLLNPVAAFC